MVGMAIDDEALVGSGDGMTAGLSDGAIDGTGEGTSVGVHVSFAVGTGVSNPATLTAWVRSGVGTQSGCGNKTALTACRAGAGKRRKIRSASIGGSTFNINKP